MPKHYEAIRNRRVKGPKKGTPAYDEERAYAAAVYAERGKIKRARSQRAKTLHGS